MMKSKLLLKCFYFTFLILLSSSLSAQSWANFFKKADKNFELGLYFKAFKENKKLKKKIPKKFANDQKLVAWNALHRARTLESLGLFVEMEEEIKIAMEMLQGNKDTEFGGYATGVLRLSDIYSEMGYFATADSLLSSLKDELEERNEKETVVYNETNYRIARGYKNIGRIKDADQILNEVLSFWKVNLNKNEGFSALTKLDLKYRKKLLASMLILKGEILTEKGSYEKADSVLKEDSKEILSNAGKKSLELTNYYRALGKNQYDNKNYKRSDKHYMRALGSTRSTGKPYLQILERLIKIDVYTDKDRQFKEKMQTWKNITKQSFKKGKYYDIRHDFLKAEQNIVRKSYGPAEKKFVKILTTSTDVLPEYHPLRSVTNDHLYDLETREDKNVNVAGARLSEMVKIKKYLLGPKSPIYQFQRIQLANYYLDYTDNFDGAKEIFASNPHLVVRSEMSNTHKNFIPLLNYTSKYFDITEDFKQAHSLLQEGVDVLENNLGEDHIETARELILLADLELKTGAYRNAEEHTNHALSVFRKELKKNDSEYADALTSGARIYDILGDYEKAQDLAFNSKKRFHKGGYKDVSEISEAVEALASINIKMGQYSETQSLLTKIIKDKEKKYGAESRNLIVPLNALVDIHLILGEYKEAQEYAQRSSEISKKVFGENSVRYATSLAKLARLNKEIGSYNKAEDFARKVVDITKEKLGKDHIQLANAYKELAIIRFLKEDLKNVEEVDKLLSEARNIILVNFDESHPMYAEIIKDLARLYTETGNFDKALKYLLQADNIYNELLGKKNRSSAEVDMLLGNYYYKTKKFNKAAEYFEKAEKIYVKIFDEEHPEYVRTLSKLAQMQYVSGNPIEATKTINKTTDTYLDFIKFHFPSLSEREKTKFWNKNKYDFEFFNTLAVNQAKSNPALIEKMYNNVLRTKALLLSTSIKVRQTIINSGNMDLINLYNDWIDKKEYLTSILAMNADQLQANGINKQEVIKEIDDLEKQLSEKSDVFKNDRKKHDITWKDVKKSLKDDEAAIEIVRFRYFQNGFSDDIKYAALIVTPETRTTPKLVLINNGKKLETNYFKFYRKNIQYEFEDEYSYNYYWKPIEDAIPSGITKVYLSPDGIYNQINLESIMIDEETFVIDKINIRLVSNTKDLLNRKKEETKVGLKAVKEGWALLFGNPKFYEKGKSKSGKGGLRVTGTSKVSQLPGTEAEIKTIRSVLENEGWKIDMYIGETAIESKIKDAQSPKVLHIATHGFFVDHQDKDESSLDGLSSKELEESPLMRSGLLAYGAGDLLAENGRNFNAGDGILTAFEAMNLNFDQTELVILSACETGLGEVMQGEGVNGLQRAFLVAGADVLIMSLFKVSDEVTEKLMTRFYENWLALGSKRIAFNKAQKEIKEEYGSPLYWGAFNMIGVE